MPHRDDYIAENPDMIFLVELRMRENWDDAFPEDSQYWLRDAQGGRVSGWGTSYLMDFTTPVVQQMIIQQAIAVSRCGLYDGIFFDWWTDKDAILAIIVQERFTAGHKRSKMPEMLFCRESERMFERTS